MSEPEPPERASLANALEQEEARLRRLEEERAEAKARADALRARLAALDAAPGVRGETVTAPDAAPRTPGEKVTSSACSSHRASSPPSARGSR